MMERAGGAADKRLTNVSPRQRAGLCDSARSFIQAKDDLFAPDGVIGEGSKKFLQGWMDLYVAWVKKYAV
jgi:chromate reductase